MDFYKLDRKKVAYMVDTFVALAELLLVLRIVLKFFFTTAGGGFVHWAFSTTDTLLAPFRVVFPGPTATPGTWYIDWVALFALAVYPAAGWIVKSYCSRQK